MNLVEGNDNDTMLRGSQKTRVNFPPDDRVSKQAVEGSTEHRGARSIPTREQRTWSEVGALAQLLRAN